MENWEEGDRHVEPDIVFSGDPGMVGSLPDNADNPMDYFQTIISENILDDVVEVYFTQYPICFALVKDPW